MQKTLSVLTAVILTLGSAGMAEKPESDPAEAILSSMTLREKAAQMMLPSFRIWKELPEAESETTEAESEAPEAESAPAEEIPAVNITELNDEIRDMLAREHFGGVLLFGENFQDTEQTLSLVAEMQSAVQEGGGVPLMIAVDEEGGSVARLKYGTIGVGNMALGATGNPGNARIMAGILGEEMGLLGIHTDFAPVMDVNSNAANPIIGIRSFSDDAETVAEYGCAYIQGLHDAGIMATMKHFPGHGNTDTDSHTGFPMINSTYEEMKAGDLIPFKAGIDAGTDMVMTAHIQFPQIEKETYTSISTGEEVYLPATMSHTILTDILRGEMGFEGVIVSDALDMDAVFKNFSTEDMLRLAVNAGVDLLILPCVKDTGLFRLTETMLDTMVALAESGEIKEERINESALRILKLKQKYGLLDQKDFTVNEEKTAAAKEGIGSAAHRETEWKIAEEALTLVKNENDAFPLRMKEGEKTLILFADSCASRAGAGDLARQLLEDKHALEDGTEILVMKNTAENEAECLAAAEAADHIILVHRMYAVACLNPETGDGFSSGTFDRIISAVHAQGKTVIVVSCALPYDTARFPDADAVLLTYWGSAMPELPAEGGAWSANLPAGLLACFGLCSTEGKLPVDIPALDEQYLPTGGILFPRNR